MAPDLITKLIAVPKAELHVHLEGTVTKETLIALAKRNRVDLMHPVIFGEMTFPLDEKLLSFNVRKMTFSEFIRIYLKITECIQTPEDILFIANDYLERAKVQNISHIECYFSPTTYLMFNRDLSRLFTGLVKAQELAKERFDITLLWIFDVVRNVSKDGFEIIDLAKSARDQGVSVAAIGLAGDESIGRTRDFAAAFSAARKLNFSTLAHAGETVGPDSIWETLEYLKPTRIGHGIRAVEDPVLLRELEKQQIPLELCPYSNVILGVYPKDNYPIAKLLDAGIPITLNSDDPGIFNRDLISNYRFAAECGLGEKELLMFAENSLTQRIF